MERALKSEVARVAPSWRLAFSRPGLVTFKAEHIDERIELVFAHVWGRSRGRAETPVAARELCAGVDRVHVFARDPDETIDLAAIKRDLGATEEPARAGELVADVIVSGADDAIVVGEHRASDRRGAYPGGGFGVVVPDDAPSRAYAKIEEAIAWRHLDVKAGQTALEIGAAPGGAVLALLRRGVNVVGVDTGAIDPHVLAYRHANGAHVTHLPIKVGALRWEAMPARVDWLLVDVNLAPQVAIHSIARLMPPMRDSLRGVVFTLKLNELRFAEELPSLLGRLEQLGFTDVRARHLPSNRQEVCAVGLR